MNRKTFAIGTGLVIGIVMAILSATIYLTIGQIDLIAEHPIMWGGSVCIATILVDAFIVMKVK